MGGTHKMAGILPVVSSWLVLFLIYKPGQKMRGRVTPPEKWRKGAKGEGKKRKRGSRRESGKGGRRKGQMGKDRRGMIRGREGKGEEEGRRKEGNGGRGEGKGRNRGEGRSE